MKKSLILALPLLLILCTWKKAHAMCVSFNFGAPCAPCYGYYDPFFYDSCYAGFYDPFWYPRYGCWGGYGCGFGYYGGGYGGGYGSGCGSRNRVGSRSCGSRSNNRCSSRRRR